MEKVVSTREENQRGESERRIREEKSLGKSSPKQ
jgi:hypothetical protein